ncbi:MAG: hypothetical protein E7047_02655 [Lentisphaerae bacterium]|nr:hypothetical protein [Lentisphaerota bacterium]
MAYDYLIRRKVFKLFGQDFHIYNPQDQLIGFCHQKAFKLKEDIRIYTDSTRQRELLTIKARNIIDFSACYDVFDPANGMLLGSWRRKGWSSLIRDKWEMLDPYGNVVAVLEEDSMELALVRRFLCNLVPQEYVLNTNCGPQANYKQRFNPFVFKLEVAIKPAFQLHPYLILAGGILLAAIEGRQN